jgi:ATP-dependent DNA helicase PIF1
MLNKIQLEAFDCMNNNKNVLITGPAGSGKSKVIEDFFESTKKNFKYYQTGSIVKTSTTGSSALLIGGYTLHSYLGIGLGNGNISTMVSNIRKNKTIRERWVNLKTLIIDEVSMLSAELFDKLEEISRIIRRNHKIFGGIQLVLVGDFCQLPIINSSRFCFESDKWNDVIEEVVYFKEIIRQKDPTYQKCLNEIRMGQCGIETLELLCSRLNKQIDKNGVVPTILYSRKVDVEKINKKNFDKLIMKGHKVVKYNATYRTEGKITKSSVQKYIEKLEKSCPAESELRLCVDAQVMIVANNSENNVVNGSRGIIKGFDEDQNPIVKLIDNREIVVERNTWSMDISDNKIIKKIQYPLKLAYAITIHKSQGMTLDYVETDIGDSIFEYGQVYVVLSRIKSLDGLILKKFNSRKIKIHPKVKEFYNKLNKL